MTRKKATRAPGPWHVRLKGTGRYDVIDANERGVIGPNQVAQANAWLIAAAPEMLEALEAALRDEVGWRRKARQAVEKAREGEDINQ